MSQYLITIDGGTTNTRAVLWNRECRAVCTAKEEVGVRNTAMDGHNGRLKEAVGELIRSLLAQAGISREQVNAVYASGMITSNVGLVEIPHLIAPASIVNFADNVQSVRIPEVYPEPIHFIPGLKNLPDSEVTLKNLEVMDIMRGEESEALALLSRIQNHEGCLLVLPGSHTKFVTVDAGGSMTGCLTSLAGEMLAVLTEYSIVADAVKRRFVSGSFDETYLLAGFRAARDTGCARAAFLTRIAGQFLTKDQNQCASFLLGAVLQNDVSAIRLSRALQVNPNMHVLIAGKEPLRSAIRALLAEDGYFSNIETVENDPDRPLAGYGALLIAKKRGDF